MQKYLQIKAPFNGIITARTANPGAYVDPSGKLRMVISVLEAYTSYINSNNEVDFTVNALPDQIIKARVIKLAVKKMVILKSMAG